MKKFLGFMMLTFVFCLITIPLVLEAGGLNVVALYACSGVIVAMINYGLKWFLD